MTLDGVVLVDKPEGMTSFAVDISMRKIADTKKVGHLGTLDPFATGMLPVFCGKGLKYMRFCEGWVQHRRGRRRGRGRAEWAQHRAAPLRRPLRRG